MEGQATALEGTQGGTDVARRSVRAHQDPPAALAQFVEPEHEFRALDGGRGLTALKLDSCHALDGADPELLQFPAPFVRPYPLDTRQERPRGNETRHEGMTSRAIEVTAFQRGLSEVNRQNNGVNVYPARLGQPELVGAERVPDQLGTW
jgi:hypothetical protein